MKKIVQLLFAVFLIAPASAQNFTGQWKGQFTDNSTSFVGWGGNRCDYVLEIECTGKNVTGYSYTYFTEGGKRFYTICKLKGTLNKASKYIEVTEIERTKTNVPNDIRNCFQIHRLTYFKQGDEQTLEGTWIPAPNQQGDCGYGSTTLSRRVLQKNPELFNNATAKPVKPKVVTPPVVKNNTDKNATSKLTKPKTTAPVVKDKPKVATPPVAVTKPDINPATTTVKPPDIVKNNTAANNDVQKPEPVKTDSGQMKSREANFEKRNNELIKTIAIEKDTFNVDLYDNGEIDGDSISLFFNGKLLLSHKRLSDKAISLKLNVDQSRDVNELIMYAENLGTIPPNTALMVVTDGDKRYEVRISSDLEKSGAIRFVHKPKNKQ